MTVIDPADLRRAFGTFLTGVTVVTCFEAEAQGGYTDRSEAAHTDMNDMALCTQHARHAAESRMGNCVVYPGNEVAGQVRAVAAGRS